MRGHFLIKISLIMRRLLFLALAVIVAVAAVNVMRVQAKVHSQNVTQSLTAADVSPGIVHTSIAPLPQFIVIPSVVAMAINEAAPGDRTRLRCDSLAYFLQRKNPINTTHFVTTKGRALRC